MFLLWPFGLCFLALQVCDHCDRDTERSGVIPLFNGTNVNVPVAKVSGTYGECGPDVSKGLFVRIDDPKFIDYIKKVTVEADRIPDDQTSVCLAENSKTCIFPFEFDGVTFDTCMSDKTCPTSVDENGKGTDFAGCTDTCPFISDSLVNDPEDGDPDQVFQTNEDPEEGVIQPIENLVEDLVLTDEDPEEGVIQPIENLVEDLVLTDEDPEDGVIQDDAFVATQNLEDGFELETTVAPSVVLIEPVPTTQRVYVQANPEAQKSVTCIYTCRIRGSCNVRVQTFGRKATVDGNVQGFCFSKIFGGRCSAIPKGCQSCAELCRDRAGEQFSVEGRVGETPESVKTKAIEPLVAEGKDQCLYSCKENRGCSVQLVTKVLTAGSIKGSCFPPSFGGKCSGIPDSCDRCLDVCQTRAGEEFMLPVREHGQAGQSGEMILVSSLAVPKRTDSCVYSCHKNGVCSVDVISDSFISGNVRGSCFPPAFGGRCNGIPKGCQPCLDICKIQPGGRFVVPIGSDITVAKPLGDSSAEAESESMKCSYKCKPTGSCSVRLISRKGHFQGNSLGSCFSRAFGGACSGTPERCDDCLAICESKNESEFQIPAKNI